MQITEKGLAIQHYAIWRLFGEAFWWTFLATAMIMTFGLAPFTSGISVRIGVFFVLAFFPVGVFVGPLVLWAVFGLLKPMRSMRLRFVLSCVVSFAITAWSSLSILFSYHSMSFEYLGLHPLAVITAVIAAVIALPVSNSTWQRAQCGVT